MLRAFIAIITNRLFWGALIVAALCLLIWIMGPFIAIGDHYPLATEVQRQIAITALISLWLLLKLLPFLYQMWANARLRRHLHHVSNVTPTARSASQSLADNFKQAASLIKRGLRLNGEQLTTRLGKFYLYRLPWYLVLGTKGCGKDKALLNSGLDFYHTTYPSQFAFPETNAESHCSWYFTLQGVILSPAGEYLKEGNPLWQTLLKLLKRYRPRQPINAVILTISVQDLLQQDNDAQYHQALLLRKRLMDLRLQLKIDFPVYVMITKSDLLPGFSSYFNGFYGEELDQVWGFTFPWEQELHSHNDLQQMLDQQYNHLQQRLDSALADTLIAQQDITQREQSFAFPQAFATLRPVLMRYLSIIFATSGFDRPWLPHGLYFTSANQKHGEFQHSNGTTQDNLFDYSYALSSVTHSNGETANRTARSYFLRQLFQKIILAESRLAGINRMYELRRRFMLLIGCGLLLSLMAGICLLLLTSYHNNNSYLAQITARLPLLEQQGQTLNKPSARDLPHLIQYLTQLQSLTANQQIDPGNPPFVYDMGLYQGPQLNNASYPVYQHALKNLLLPLVTQQVESILRQQADSNNSESTYEALKAYQMLFQTQHYDGKFLTAWLMLNLSHIPGGEKLNEVQRKTLQEHLYQLLNHSQPSWSQHKDQQLIQEAIKNIMRSTFSQRVYTSIKKRLINNGHFKSVNLLDLAGSQAELVLKRKSDLPDTATIPGFFTPDGYWHGLVAQVDNTVKTLHDTDSWVLNIPPQVQEGCDAACRVRQLYMDDFMLEWDTFLNDIVLIPTSSLNQRINNVRILSGAHSPLRNLLIGISHIVALSPPEDHGKLTQLGQQLNDEATRKLQNLFPAVRTTPAPPSPEQIVRSHYRDLLDLARPQGDHSDTIAFDDLFKKLGDLYRYLTALQENGEATASSSGTILTQLQADAGRLPAPFRSIIMDMTQGAKGDTQQQAVSRIHQLASAQLSDFCREAIAGRYPLSRHSKRDITPDDMAHMFAPNQGLMDRFFNQYLVDKVNTQGGEWRFFPWALGSTKPEDQSLLKTFRQAQFVRDAFFSTASSQPSFSLTLQPLRMDNDILTLSLTLNDQSASYSHGPLTSWYFTWPGSNNTGKAKLTMLLANGKTKSLETSGPWALNRLIDAGKWFQEDNTHYRITFNLAGHQATLILTPDSIHNPFVLPEFTCIKPS
ncbi:type VI secretion system membrane subunit TssM [Photorhabdus heterorhabditis]|uniref:type VI secretion system membrane subunit TssM n=1 Tax=Photorhabdus heterorhabditis TaxID=880156 RepID=UPI001562695C|nr:type VI secretion system membrane subunit TssM [Photorhabdus heterorhabditis]NRN28986.1 type VI secretion system membrane subunit TssM [Photorhabdus heterorhabditis subsp. aluminescens]